MYEVRHTHICIRSKGGHTDQKHELGLCRLFQAEVAGGLHYEEAHGMI
jgi:hypothetical protein